MQEQFPVAPQPQVESQPDQSTSIVENDTEKVTTNVHENGMTTIHTESKVNSNWNVQVIHPGDVELPVSAPGEQVHDDEKKQSFLSKIVAKFAGKKAVAAALIAPAAVLTGSQAVETVAPEAPAPVVASVESDPSSSFLDATEVPTDTFNMPQGGGAPTEYTAPTGNVYLPPVTPEQPQSPIIDTPTNPLQGIESSVDSNYANEMGTNREASSTSYQNPAESSPESAMTDYDASANHVEIEKDLHTDAVLEGTTVR